MKKLEDRCPWCGELLYDPSKKSDSKVFFKQFDPFAIKCNYCNNMSTRVVTFPPLILLIVGIVIGNVCPIPEVASIPFIIMIYLLGFRIAYEKKATGKWDQHLPKDILVGSGVVEWYPNKKGGIGLPRTRIPNYYIFPICFVDKDKKPISPMICMRFVKKGLWLTKCNFDMYSIIEYNIKFLNNDFHKFIIFSEKIPIGEGNIRLDIQK